ncbi:hypothetical protein, partial [Arcanobacterium bovis]
MITVRSTAKHSYLKAYKKHQHKPVRKTAAFTASTVHKTVTASTMEQPGEEQRRLPDSKRSRRFIKNGFTHAQVKARTINPKRVTAQKAMGGNSRVR